MPSLAKPRCAIYTRVSTIVQEDNYSLSTQEAACRAYAEQHGYRIAGVFSDVHTGSEYRERTGLSDLRQAVRDGAVDVVLAYALDRLSRNQAHVYIILEEAEDHGVRLEFVTEDFENTAVGKLIRSVKAFAGELELAKITERTQRGRRARVESGRMMPGRRPRYGYQWADNTHSTLIVNPVTGPIAQRIFRDIAGGKTLRSVAMALQAEGIPTPGGRGSWRHSMLHFILHDPAYVGDAYAFRYKTEKVNGRRLTRMLPPEEWIPLPDGTIPPLVDRATFDAVAAILKRNQAKAARNNQHPEETLLRAGYIVCGCCGYVMGVSRSTVRGAPRVNYTCRANVVPGTCSAPANISALKIDPIVWDHVRDVLLRDEIIESELKRLRSSDPAEADLTAIDRAMTETKRRQANLVRQLAAFDDDETISLIQTEMKSLARQRQTLETERQSVIRQQDAWKLAQAHLDQLRRWRQMVAKNLDELDYAGKRQALDALGVKVTAYPQDHQPRYEIRASLPIEIPIADDDEECDDCVSNMGIFWNSLR